MTAAHYPAADGNRLPDPEIVGYGNGIVLPILTAIGTDTRPGTKPPSPGLA